MVEIAAQWAFAGRLGVKRLYGRLLSCMTVRNLSIEAAQWVLHANICRASAWDEVGEPANVGGEGKGLRVRGVHAPVTAGIATAIATASRKARGFACMTGCAAAKIKIACLLTRPALL